MDQTIKVETGFIFLVHGDFKKSSNKEKRICKRTNVL